MPACQMSPGSDTTDVSLLDVVQTFLELLQGSVRSAWKSQNGSDAHICLISTLLFQDFFSPVHSLELYGCFLPVLIQVCTGLKNADAGL